MNKAVFLDRDGTINEDYGYLYEIEKFRFLDGVLEGLKKFQDEGYMLVIITNQSGIARGYYSENDYEKLSDWMVKELEKRDIHIKKMYYCPHHPDSKIEKYKKNCKCRKPELGLFYEAIKELDIDLNSSIAIGDRDRDVAICKETSIKGFVIYSEDERTEGNIRYVRGGINEVAEMVVNNESI